MVRGGDRGDRTTTRRCWAGRRRGWRFWKACATARRRWRQRSRAAGTARRRRRRSWRRLVRWRSPGASIDALRAEDLSGLSGLRLLDLRGNVLKALPAGLLSNAPALRALLLGGNQLTTLAADALASVPELRELDLSNNALATLAPDQFEGLAALRWLRLDGNALEELPEGLFAGVAHLLSLRLDGNPGAPFALRLKLERTDAEPWAQGPATIRATMPTGAPFDIEVDLSAAGGALRDAAGAAAESLRVLAGETQSATSTVTALGGGPIRVEASTPSAPDTICDGLPCWRGLELAAGEPLELFSQPTSPAQFCVLDDDATDATTVSITPDSRQQTAVAERWLLRLFRAHELQCRR